MLVGTDGRGVGIAAQKHTDNRASVVSGNTTSCGPLSVIAPEFMRFWDGETGSPIFAKRNIFAPSEFMYFL
jgi:hypothetical protein